MSFDELAYLPATEARLRFASGELSPAELLDALVARAEAAEPVVNAFTDTFFDEARARAEQAASAYAAGTARPLEGICVAVKDEVPVKGQRHTEGSLLFGERIADSTAPLVQRILDAGGIIHARSATPEFSMATVTWSLLHGVTRNPWNPAITCGGSSGGAGASLAAGTSTLATGSDLAGSIRIPAAFNGVVGFKPPWGRVGEEWPWNREPYAASGPLARTVDDVALLANVMGGPLDTDMFSLSAIEDHPIPVPPATALRVALSPDLGYFSPDAEVTAALDGAAAALRSTGIEVEPVELGWTDAALFTALIHFSVLSGAVVRGCVPPGDEGRVTPYIREFLETDDIEVAAWMDSWRYGDEMYRELQRRVFAAGFDALICPTMATTHIRADRGHPDTDPGATAAAIDDCMTYPFNVLGRLPVVNVPVAMSRETGVPIGMQIVGGVDDDLTSLRIAAAHEHAAGPLAAGERPRFSTECGA